MWQKGLILEKKVKFHVLLSRNKYLFLKIKLSQTDTLYIFRENENYFIFLCITIPSLAWYFLNFSQNIIS